jgi:hypothetical protein
MTSSEDGDNFREDDGPDDANLPVFDYFFQQPMTAPAFAQLMWARRMVVPIQHRRPISRCRNAESDNDWVQTSREIYEACRRSPISG